MASGIPYDSAEGRAICGAHLGHHDRRRLRHLGRDGQGAGAVPRLRRQRRRHAARHPQPPPRGLRAGRRLREAVHAAGAARRTPPAPTSASSRRPSAPGTSAIALGQEHGYRNAQATVIAPTGTIGLVMDCDTTGIEPDFALVKFKKLAGGGYFKIINQAVPEALRTLGYREARDRRDRGLRGRPRHAGARRRPSTTPRSRPRASPTRCCARSRRALEDGVRHQVRLQPLDARRGVPHRDAEDPGRDARRSRLRPARAPRLLQEGHRGRQRARLRRHDAGRRAAHRRASTCRSSIAPTPAAARASATSRWRATSA